MADHLSQSDSSNDPQLPPGAVAASDRTQPVASTFPAALQVPLLIVAMAGFGLAGQQAWSNRAVITELVSGSPASSCPSHSACESGCRGGCPSESLGCPSEHKCPNSAETPAVPDLTLASNPATPSAAASETTKPSVAETQLPVEAERAAEATTRDAVPTEKEPRPVAVPVAETDK